MIRLGSKSPTRALLLEQFKIPFVQDGGEFDEEQIKEDDPYEFVKIATRGKFDELFGKFGCEIPLLVADSVVVCDGKLLRKPKTKKEAKAMLELQSGNCTTVITCMIFQSKSSYLFDISQTSYRFAPFGSEAIERYVESGEAMGKAGAIMVEGFCKPYIQSVDGYQSTAMGLCVEKILPFV